MVDITLILPAYNEATSIEQTLREAVHYFELSKLSFQIIVAADGNDGTREIVRRLASSDGRLQVIGHTERSGKGRGVREAMKLAVGNIVGFADADNKVPLDELHRFLPRFKEGYSVIIGSRAMKESQIERQPPFHRRLGSKLFTVGLWTVVGRLATDTQCGFKFFTREAALQIFNLQRIDGYMFDVEVLALAKAFGFSVCEIPVRWRDDGDTRLQLFRGNVRNMIDLFRIRASLTKVVPDKSKSYTAAASRQ